MLPILPLAPGVPGRISNTRPAEISRILRQFQEKLSPLGPSLIAWKEKSLLEILTQSGPGEKDLDATAAILETEITSGSGELWAEANSQVIRRLRGEGAP